MTSGQQESWLGAGFTIFEWSAWEGFLASQLFPKCSRVGIDPFSDREWDKCVAALDATDAVLFQINLAQTKLAPPFRQRLHALLGERRICALNADVTDLRKRVLQGSLRRYGLRSTLAKLHGAPDELLIVKTDLNHGGLHERKVDPSRLRSLGLDLPPSLEIDAKSYPLLMRKDIPDDWYRDGGLIFERYIGNTRERFHRAYVCGEHVIVCQAHAAGHIKKLQHDSRDINYFFFRDEFAGGRIPLDCDGLEPLDTLSQLGAFLEIMAVDYAAIDIVNDGTAAYIVDINTTPWAGESLPDEDAAQFLRLGIQRRIAEFKDDVAKADV